MGRPATDIRERLVDSARAHFLAQGVDGASLRKIAADAETSIGMIHYHFGTKDKLFLEVFEVVYEGLQRDLKRILDASRTVEDRLAGMFERFARMSDEEADTLRLVLREGMASSERLEAVIERFQRGHLPDLLQTFTDGFGEGRLDDQHGLFPPLAATMFSSLLVQLLRRRVPDRAVPVPLPAPAELATAMHHILLHGIARHDGPSPS